MSQLCQTPYYRVTGYFSSSTLAAAASKGIAGLIKKWRPYTPDYTRFFSEEDRGNQDCNRNTGKIIEKFQ
jgi:hypothetical protein